MIDQNYYQLNQKTAWKACKKGLTQGRGGSVCKLPI